MKVHAAKAVVAQYRLTNLARAYYRHCVTAVKSQYLADFKPQLMYIIPITLLSKTAKAVHILTNLRRGKAHLLAQILRRYALHALHLKPLQIPVIAWQTAYHSP